MELTSLQISPAKAEQIHIFNDFLFICALLFLGPESVSAICECGLLTEELKNKKYHTLEGSFRA